ncbi:MAG TPA: nucleotide-binding protein [Streptosporangiaceae bacterium]
MPYHIRVFVEGETDARAEVKLDLDEATLERQFLRPYREGRNITVNGRSIPPDRIHRLKLSYSDLPSVELIKHLRQQDAAQSSPGIRAFGATYSYSWRAAAGAQDVTDEFIEGPPGAAGVSQNVREEASPSTPTPDRRSIFLVHGRWAEAAEAMRAFLTSLDLKVIEWEQAAQSTGKASPYIGEILDAGFAMAHAAVVLMTPDDVACLNPSLLPDGQQPEPLTGQPRPNVIFEGGMAWQQFRERTLLVEVGSLRGFSDLAGVYTVRLDGSPETRRAVASRLKTAGCAVDDSGDRWLSAGSFPPPLARPTAAALGIEVVRQVEARGTVEPVGALRGIPLRWILLARLAEMHRAQAVSSHVLTLDVEGIAGQTAAEVADVKAVLSELIGEGLVEGYAETFGQTAVDGACRITGAGLRRLRAEA